MTFLNYLYLCLNPPIWQIFISGIICIWLFGKFYYLELSVTGYPANFTIRNYLYPAIQQMLLSGIICIWQNLL